MNRLTKVVLEAAGRGAWVVDNRERLSTAKARAEKGVASVGVAKSLLVDIAYAIGFEGAHWATLVGEPDCEAIPPEIQKKIYKEENRAALCYGAIEEESRKQEEIWFKAGLKPTSLYPFVK